MGTVGIHLTVSHANHSPLTTPRMPGTRRQFEQEVEATLARHDGLDADVRADVLQQHANQLRTDN